MYVARCGSLGCPKGTNLDIGHASDNHKLAISGRGVVDTAKIAAPISGDKLYQARARVVLPILVRQAEAGTPIFYSALAEEVGIPNPRNLNYVLGSIGTTLENLSKAWKQKVPPIQCLVVNKNTGLPGEGIGWFLVKKEAFSLLNRRQQRAIVEAELQDVFSFGRWHDVLSVLSLQPVESDFSAQIRKAASFGGGESEAHKRLKVYVSKNPTVVGLPASTPAGVTEFSLASGDAADVHFQDKKDWVAVEVKSAISNEPDITRGLFQCVKYKAVLEAMQLASGLPQNARAILALETKLPSTLVALKNILGVEVVEAVSLNG